MENAFFGNVMNKKEKAILRLLYERCTGNKGSCILAPMDILRAIPLDIELKREELEPVLEVLGTDDYFDMTISNRKGERVYCFTLKKKGLNIQREEQKAKKELAKKLLIAVLAALVTFAVGQLLRGIWG